MVIYIFKTGHRVNLLILVIDLHIVAYIYIYTLYILLKRTRNSYLSKRKTKHWQTMQDNIVITNSQTTLCYV